MSQFKNFVFEGGGVKGIAYAGAIKQLDQKNMLESLSRVAGTSAGAITATLLAMGAGWEDIRDIVGGTDFRKFMDDSWGLIRDVSRLIKDYGWYKGDAFARWMKKQIYALTGKQNLTFGELENLKSQNPEKYRSLYIVGTNLSTQLSEIYSPEHTPEVEIGYAVRVSMSIPFFFAAVKKDDDILVDGGVTWNYPIDLFDDKKYLSNPDDSRLVTLPKYPTVYSSTHVYNKETLGFRVDTNDEIAVEKQSWRLPPQEIENFGDYAKALIGFMTDMANKVHLHQNDWHRTVFIDARGVRTTDFDLPNKKVAELIESGEQGIKEYFEWFENEKESPLNRVAAN